MKKLFLQCGFSVTDETFVLDNHENMINHLYLPHSRIFLEKDIGIIDKQLADYKFRNVHTNIN